MKKIIFSNKYLMKIIYYGLLSMLLLFMILNQKLGNMDEIWNFSFAKNIHDGLIPYNDFNLISTPLSCFLNSIFLSIDSSLITFRISYFIYYLIILYLLDNILNKLNIKEILKYIIIFLIIIILVKSCYLDYNFIQIGLILTIILLQLKNKDFNNHKLNIIIPIITGLTIVNKQSSGLLIILANIFLMVLNKHYFKKNINYKFIMKEIILMLIPTLIFIIYLLTTKSYASFYDLAIVGLTTFTNKYTSKIFLYIIIVYIPIIIEMYIKKKKETYWILFIYSLTSLSFIIPILDKVHAAYTVIIPFIFIITIINSKLDETKISLDSKYTYLLVPVFVTFLIINIYTYYSTLKNTTGIYKYIPTTTSQQKVIEDVDNYIIDKSKDNEVYILDISAALFNLNIGKYHKYFDMFMNGNFGINGTKEIYSIIDSENKIFMINDFENHWQSPTDIVDYIKESYHICGAIDYLTVYCKD